MPGPLETRIRTKIETELQPTYLELDNESHSHSVPANSETHFRLFVVSEKFNGLTRIARQRLVNELLKAELSGGVHALTQRTLTPDEWQTAQSSADFVSPNCHGGSRREQR